MAGGNHPPKSSSHNSNKPSSSHRKSRWEPPAGKSKPSPNKPSDPKSKPSPKPTPQRPAINPSPKPDPNNNNHFNNNNFPSRLPPFPFRDPPPPPTYGSHMLDRHTIVLANGALREYHALPPDYQDFAPIPRLGPGLDPRGPMSPDERNRHPHDHWSSLALEGGGMKRKLGDEGRDGLERLRQQVLEHGNPSGVHPPPPGPATSLYPPGRGDNRPAKVMRTGGFEGSASNRAVSVKHSEVDQNSLNKSFLLMVKLIYENATHKRTYLADGKHGRLHCLACNRTTKQFPDMHSLIMHAYNPDSADSFVEHLAFHKALCVLMGWNYSTPPDNSKSYQMLSAQEAAANRDDLILWPPLVIIHNTVTGKRADGRMEGLGNKAMDNYLRDIGCHGGKAKALYSRDGHLGITLVKFGSDQKGLMEAMRLSEHFEKENRGRQGWARVQPLTLGKDDENHPDLVKVDHRGEKTRVFYGYLGTLSDIEKIDTDFRKKISIASQGDYKLSLMQ